MDRDVYVKLLEKLHEAAGIISGNAEIIDGLREDISGLEEDISGLEEGISGLQTAITITTSPVSGNVTVAGQSYTDIFSNLPAGTYIIVVDYTATCPLIICKGSIGTSSNIFGDVSSGGVVYLSMDEATTIQMYANTDDATDVTLYRVKINAIKIG